MRKFATLTALILLAALPALAQDDYPKAEFFNGFSYFNVDTPGAAQSFFGYQTNLGINFRRHVGFAMDFGAQFKNEAGVTLQSYQYLFGPRVVAHGNRFSAFAHALVGAATFRAGGFSDTGFAMGLGGGLDANITQGFAFRIMQVDYIPEHVGGAWGHNVRVGIGVVLKLGGD
jgi:hypothetical protein